MENVKVVYTLIQNSQKQILMVLNKGFDWTLPGGKVEDGETLIEAAIREAKEETGLDIKVGPLLAVNESKFQDKGHHALFFTFKAEIIRGTLKIQMADEIEQLEWVTINQANERMPYFSDGIDYILQNRGTYINQTI